MLTLTQDQNICAVCGWLLIGVYICTNPTPCTVCEACVKQCLLNDKWPCCASAGVPTTDRCNMSEIRQELGCGAVIEGGTKDVYEQHIRKKSDGEPCTNCLMEHYNHTSRQNKHLITTVRNRDEQVQVLTASQERVANTIEATTDNMLAVLDESNTQLKRKREEHVVTITEKVMKVIEPFQERQKALAGDIIKSLNQTKQYKSIIEKRYAHDQKQMSRERERIDASKKSIIDEMKRYHDRARAKETRVRAKMHEYIAVLPQMETNLQLLKEANTKLCHCHEVNIRPPSPLHGVQEVAKNEDQIIDKDDDDYYTSEIGLMELQWTCAKADCERARQELLNYQRVFKRVKYETQVYSKANARTCSCRQMKRRRLSTTSEDQTC